MKKIEKILVGLELTKSDLSLIRYVKNLADVVKPEKIDFIHVVESLTLDVSDEVENFTPLDEQLEAEMRKEVDLYFESTEINQNFEVIEGGTSEQILHWAAVKGSDLIVLGRKNDKIHAEITLEKIVRTAPCSVLVVPQLSESDFGKILFPVDYSNKTVEGIEILNAQFDNPSIEMINFFELPSGYYKTGKSEEEFIDILKRNADKEAENILKKAANTDKVNVNNKCSEGIDEFEHIVDFAKENKCGMVAIGSRGRTLAASLLMGSFAEKFIRHNRAVPTFVFKTKGENMDFLKAFLKF